MKFLKRFGVACLSLSIVIVLGIILKILLKTLPPLVEYSLNFLFMALVITMLIPIQEKSIPKKTEHWRGNLHFCPTCNFLVLLGDNHCPHCGQALSWNELEGENNDKSY